MRLALAAALLLAPLAAASDGPGPMETGTDGIAFAEDDPAVLAAIEAVRADVSGERIHDCVRALTSEGATRYRVMGTPTHDQFVAAHKDVFGALGLLTALHEFDEGAAGVGPARSPDKGGTNIVGVLPGRDLARWVVVGGHYDTREFTLGGGALDNASGICTVEELARATKAYVDAHGPLEATLVFLWYDGEEWGLHGAVAFANDDSAVRGLLGLAADAPVDVLVSQSYDMPGLNYPAKNTWARYGDPATTDEYAVLNLRAAPIEVDDEWRCWSYGCYEELKERDDFARVLDRNTRYHHLLREIAYDVLALPPEHVWVYDDEYGRSDHIPLIAKGAAGNRIQGSHDEEYPHYHQPTDTLDAIYLLAGSKENLIAAYATEAQAGGLAAFYVALTGGHGPYGPSGAMATDAAGATGDSASTSVPGIGALATLAGLAAAGSFGPRRIKRASRRVRACSLPPR
ncbi:MAG TPA: M28 family peptidase [Candidatus Thermoplasmatota archaeon]|nr:M28 family peptidase [Candidatus Thermoplasmatota archaeon]